MFTLVRRKKIDSKDDEGRRRMRGSDGKLYFSKNKRKSLKRSYNKHHEENNGDHVEGDVSGRNGRLNRQR